MKILEFLLNESYKNLFTKDTDEKLKYIDQVWDILQTSYSNIGGLKGSGFSSKEDIIAKIPMWKLAVNNGKVEVVVMYKDKGGRKAVAIGSTGSDWAKKKIVEIFKAQLGRAYSEKSKASLGAVLKLWTEEDITPFLKSPKEAEGILKTKVISLVDVPVSDWPKDGVKTVQKYPYIKKYAYLREIGGSLVFKVMLGTTGNNIKN